MKRIAGLDVGEKTIGVAVSDYLGLTAQGIKTINRKNIEKDLYELETLLKEFEVNLIVVGLPRNMNGTYGKSAERAWELGGLIEQNLGYEVEYWDERLSTASAEKTLLQSDMSRKKRKKVIDKLAAVIILQNYLDFSNK